MADLWEQLALGLGVPPIATSHELHCVFDRATASVHLTLQASSCHSGLPLAREVRPYRTTAQSLVELDALFAEMRRRIVLEMAPFGVSPGEM